MKHLAALILMMGCVAMSAMGEDNVDGFVARLYRARAGQTMPYRLFVPPGYDKSNKYPLVLWLHGAGGIGKDNRRQIQHDQVPGTRLWTKRENQARHPAFVLVPQSAAAWSGNELSMIPGVLDVVASDFNIDLRRIYVLGQSIGGLAAWQIVTEDPDRFAAAVFVCSVGARETHAKRVVNLPLWAFEGSNDSPVARTRAMIEAIRKAGGSPHYTEYPGMGHSIWDRVFKEPELVEWLFAQHR
jgi:predicted peptidase